MKHPLLALNSGAYLFTENQKNYPLCISPFWFMGRFYYNKYIEGKKLPSHVQIVSFIDLESNVGCDNYSRFFYPSPLHPISIREGGGGGRGRGWNAKKNRWHKFAFDCIWGDFFIGCVWFFYWLFSGVAQVTPSHLLHPLRNTRPIARVWFFWGVVKK